MESSPEEPRLRLVVADDLRRSRLTVLLRLLLALPHLIWLSLWAIAVSVLALALWLAVLIDGRLPSVLHDFAASFVRYATHVGAYLFLIANPYPSFRGATTYPVDVDIPPPQRQSRWTALFRLVLAFPALLLAGVLAGTFGGGSSTSYSGGVLGAVALLGWFAALALGRMPRGLRDLGAYGLGYGAWAAAYVLLLTGRYPNARPSLVSPPQELPGHQVRLALADEGTRSRAVVFFRPLLVLPHIVWIVLWGVAALGAIVAGWFAALAVGRLPTPLHRFLAAYVRYWAHVTAFASVTGGPFPGFAGTPGAYTVDIEIASADRQHRLAVLARSVLALPAVFLALTLWGAVLVVALLGWFAALFTARMPRGLLELGAVSIRYQAQTAAYLSLVAGRYPYAAPAVAAPVVAEEGAA